MRVDHTFADRERAANYNRWGGCLAQEERCQGQRVQPLVPVTGVVPESVSVCRSVGGAQSTAARLEALIHTLQSAGVSRLLIVGGAPDSHRELREGFARSDFPLELVDGTRRISAARAAASARRAGLVVIWAGTLLNHAVSGQFRSRVTASKTVVVPRPGVAALVMQLQAYVLRRPLNVCA
jgi:hypothetical protein